MEGAVMLVVSLRIASNFQILVSLRVFWAKRHYILIAAKVSLGLHAKKYKNIYIFQLYIRFIYSIHVIKV